MNTIGGVSHDPQTALHYLKGTINNPIGNGTERNAIGRRDENLVRNASQSDSRAITQLERAVDSGITQVLKTNGVGHYQIDTRKEDHASGHHAKE